jgi:hypothetical protein
MVPTMILIGLAIGFLPRPWRLAGMILASISWPILLLASGTGQAIDVQSRLGEAAIAAANVGFAVLVVRRLIIPLGITVLDLAGRADGHRTTDRGES